MCTINKKGLSLTELLIATAVIGVIMLGVISSDFAVRRMSQSSGRRAQVSISASAAMQRIVTEATYAYGTSTDDGVVFNDTNDYLCLRQTDVGVVPAEWSCYDLDAGDNVLYACSNTAVGACLIDREYIAVLSSFDAEWVNDPEYHLTITLTAQFDPDLPDDPKTNPSVTLSSGVTPRNHRN